MIILLTLLLILIPSLGQATTRAAANCGNVAVQTQINASATRGDTVIVPAGNCIWTTTVSIAGKSLTLTGAGKGITNITDQTSGTLGALSVTSASSLNYVDISGFSFIASTAHSSGVVQLTGTQFSVAGRFHHNTIAATVGRGMSAFYAYFLIDNNNITASPTIQGIAVHGGTTGGADGGYLPWQQPLTLGSANCTYIEDNTFVKTAFGSAEDIIDAYAGARICVRHNDFLNTKVGFHGTDSGGIRSPVSWEIYNNTFRNTLSGVTAPYAFRVRGGTGVVFGNTWTLADGAVGWGNLQIVYYRACNVFAAVKWWGANGCDGTQYVVGSTVLSSDASRRACDIKASPLPGLGGCSFFPRITWEANVKWCSGNYDKPCSSDATCAAAGVGVCTRYFDGSGTGGYPGRDQPGIAPGQVVEPIYFWSNTGAFPAAFDLQTVNNCNGFGLANYILAGRDYIDNGTTPKPGYMAYTYPHPAQAGPSTFLPTPDPSTNLRVVGTLGVGRD